VTVTGAWVDAILTEAAASSEELLNALLGELEFRVPGLVIEPESQRAVGSGHRFSFSVKAHLGIASGSDMLVRIPGGAPRGFAAVPSEAGAFSFEFPFVFEQRAEITTPAGFKTLMLPGGLQSGDSKAMLTESVTHWNRSRRIVASSVWTLRSPEVDSVASGRVREQLNLARGWSETTVPLRK
jgi:hypothetical protein